jgi:cytochrome c peroxidase
MIKTGCVILVLILFASAGKQFVRSKSLRLNYPTSWPAPNYDFKKNPVTQNGFDLGKKLFYDPVLSRDSSISCASCHLQYTGFTHIDHAVSHGIEGKKGKRNTLALINLAWNKSFHWDGGVNNIEVQPLNPITNPVEMDSKITDVLKKLNRSATYKKLFALIFGEGEITGQHLLKALSQYTLMLVSGNSKYDKYIRHEKGGKFTAQEKNGLKLFRKNCASCHAEPLFTNNGFANNGLAVDPFYNDYGRISITHNAGDSLKFRVPTLRNIEFTYPYMHDGRFVKLKEVINHYTGDGIKQSSTLAPELKKPIALTTEEKVDLLAFLLTLTDRDFLYNEQFKYKP